MRAALLTILWLPMTPTPDMILPGHKSVRHELLLEWDTDANDCSFVAYPTRGFHVPVEIRPGEPFEFSSKYGTRIYAMPDDAAVPESRDGWLDVAWPTASVPVQEVRSVASGNPLARVETTLRVDRVTTSGIEFTVIGERRMDANGNDITNLDWLLLPLIAATGAIILLVLRRRSSRSTTEAPA